MTTKKENTKQTYSDFVNEIAQGIKEIIKNGGATWKDVFNREGCGKLPVNAKGNLYSGVNVLNLYMTQLKKNYKSNQWLTFKQIKELNGSVNKGEKSSRVFFFTSYDKEKIAQEDFRAGDKKIKKGDTYETTILCPKNYAVFNLSQTTLDDTENAVIFDSEENYKAVLLHELAHSTMHEKRINSLS